MGYVRWVPSNGCCVFVALVVVRFLVLVHVVGAAAGRSHVMRGCVLISAMSAASALGSINRVWVELLMIGSWTIF